jgi:polyketide cyclase/dehydrase/lipid transport protein
MPALQLRAVVDGVDPESALRRVTDYRTWPAASAAIRSVEVAATDAITSVSSWEVSFRGGLMRWTERDVLCADALEQRFSLVEGDPADFTGAWSAAAWDGGCTLRLSGEFDLGMPSLRHVLDPIAIEALEEAITEVLEALFAGRIRVGRAEAVT